MRLEPALEKDLHERRHTGLYQRSLLSGFGGRLDALEVSMECNYFFASMGDWEG
jgi:hypothetical protein